MIIGFYSGTGLVEQKFLRIYEGQILTALYLDGSKASVKIVSGKAYRI
jgi:hypothetical protein